MLSPAAHGDVAPVDDEASSRASSRYSRQEPDLESSSLALYGLLLLLPSKQAEMRFRHLQAALQASSRLLVDAI